jgi:serine-type D-Ala-D-Ala carboxypeptidase (penicillin-binding protein 5/6)
MNIFFSKKQIRLFISTMIAMFVVVTLQLFGIKPPQLINPLPQQADIYYDKVSPLLDKGENTYTVHKENKIIAQAHAAGDFDEASAYAVLDFSTGSIIASKHSDQRLPIASLTKIMTAVVALDLASPSESFPVSKNAARTIPTKIAVEPGEEYTLEELLHAALLTSANDAVQVIREGVDAKYGADVFVRAMNEKALLLGLSNSSFANPQGFDNQSNYSSAEDLANLTHYALENYPLIKEIAKKDASELSANEHHKHSVLYNWNGLIDVYPDTIGMKIGNTDAAGKTTVVISERAGKKLLVVVLGAPGIIERDLWAAQLLDLGYSESLGLAAVDVTKEDLRAKYATWRAWN